MVQRGLGVRTLGAKRIEVRWAVDDTTGCWNWLLAKCTSGYGQEKVLDEEKGRWCTKTVHKRMYEKKNGPVPQGYELDHLCRNRGCVNPDHLEPVTDAINTRRGSRAKLTEEQALFIRENKTAFSQRQLAKRFNVTQTAVWYVQNNHTWR